MKLIFLLMGMMQKLHHYNIYNKCRWMLLNILLARLLELLYNEVKILLNEMQIKIFMKPVLILKVINPFIANELQV